MGNTSSATTQYYYDIHGDRHSTSEARHAANDKSGIKDITYIWKGENNHTVQKSNLSHVPKPASTVMDHPTSTATKRGREDDDAKEKEAKKARDNARNCYLDAKMYVKDAGTYKKAGVGGGMLAPTVYCASNKQNDEAWQKGLRDGYKEMRAKTGFDKDDTGQCRDSRDLCKSSDDCGKGDVCSVDKDSIPNPN
jgi:hypothetical protein